MSKETGIDLYCGCGGMSSGAVRSIPDLEIKWALDRDKSAANTFAKAHSGAVVDCADVAAAAVSDILDRTGIDGIDWFFAGPTCQAVSTMGLFNAADQRNAMFVHFARLLKGFVAAGRRPGTIVLENVPGVVYGSNVSIVRSLFDFLGDLGYFVYADVLNLAALGLPQLRHRFILVATTSPQHPTFPSAVRSERDDGLPFYVSVREAIGDIYAVEPAQDGDSVRYAAPAASAFQRAARSRASRLENHWSRDISPVNVERIATVPQGGSWKDIPADLLPTRFQRVRMTDYATLYGRLHEDNPAYTLSAGFGNVTAGCFTHPRHDRCLTVREGARLQGFHDDFVFAGPRGYQYKLVGNAVPPLAMAAIAKHLRSDDKGAPARITAETLGTGRRLPPMTRRFQSKRTNSTSATEGYGGGTHWPVGWGVAPAAMPTFEENYRKDASPLRYLRQDRRRMAEAFASPLVASVGAYPVRNAAAERIDISLEPAKGIDAIDVAAVKIVAFLREQRDAMTLRIPFAYLGERIRILAEACRTSGLAGVPAIVHGGCSAILEIVPEGADVSGRCRVVLVELEAATFREAPILASAFESEAGGVRADPRHAIAIG